MSLKSGDIEQMFYDFLLANFDTSKGKKFDKTTWHNMRSSYILGVATMYTLIRKSEDVHNMTDMLQVVRKDLATVMQHLKVKLP